MQLLVQNDDYYQDGGQTMICALGDKNKANNAFYSIQLNLLSDLLNDLVCEDNDHIHPIVLFNLETMPVWLWSFLPSCDFTVLCDDI